MGFAVGKSANREYLRRVNALRMLGRMPLDFIAYLGGVGSLVGETGESLVRGRRRWRVTLAQIAEIGFRSQPVVIITGAFTGAVLAAQALFQFSALNMETAGGALVSVAMLRELGPTITALMLAGRVGAAMAAEIGTMKVTEQIDALRSMDVHPIDYLVTPRLLAMLISMPLLIAESAAFGIVASFIVGVYAFHVTDAYWLANMQKFTELADIFIAMVKGLVFGVLTVMISCHQGLTTTNGAVGVGRATTRAMVYSSLAILISNFFLTLLMNTFFPSGVGR
jgi:phospholipid/cholesterol/gamma-HCH transport system permease protein